MRMRTIITALMLIGMMAGIVALTGCHTWKGAGKDIERTGESMQGED